MYCHLDKWQIWGYTLPQIAELMKRVNKYIQFEVEVKLAPLGMFVPRENKSEENTSDDDEYKEITEDDIFLLSQILGGGA